MWPGECRCDCHYQLKNQDHDECCPQCRHEGVPECVCPIPGSSDDESAIQAAKKCYLASPVIARVRVTHVDTETKTIYLSSVVDE